MWHCKRECAAVRQCVTVSVRQCVAVQQLVLIYMYHTWESLQSQCACNSVQQYGSVRQCGNMWQCGSRCVRQRVRGRGIVCAAPSAAVRQFAAVL
jgi:hypothetical protein